MTISVKVAVNGNYKVPVTVTQGSRQETIWISGRGHNGPNEVNINYDHGGDSMTLNIGPEEQDNGEPETEVVEELDEETSADT